MMSPGPLHSMILRARLGPENGPGLQKKEYDYSMVIPYTLVASPWALTKRSFHRAPELTGHWSRTRGPQRNLWTGRSDHGRSLRGICSSRPLSQNHTESQNGGGWKRPLWVI